MCPSGNSNASWCVRGSLLLICRKMAVVCSIVFTLQPNKPIRALCVLLIEGEFGARKNTTAAAHPPARRTLEFPR